jgi:hypothetical protein
MFLLQGRDIFHRDLAGTNKELKDLKELFQPEAVSCVLPLWKTFPTHE